MQIYVSRDGNNFGPYSLEDVREMIHSGQLRPGEPAWHDGMKEWLPLASIPGVMLIKRQSSGAGDADPQQSKKDEDTRSDAMEAVGCLFPLLGLIFWAVYANSKPKRARHIGIYSAVGFLTVFALIIIVKVVNW